MDQRLGRWGAVGVVATGSVALLCFAVGGPGASRAVGGAVEKVATAADGAELFRREWIPGDSRSHGGDGLGPLYNETSCISCHNQGGAGGGGPAGKNVEILTAFENVAARFNGPVSFVGPVPTDPFGGSVPAVTGTVLADPPPPQPASPEQIQQQMTEQRQQQLDALVKLHPGFKFSRSVVLHRYGTYAAYEAWRLGLKGTPVATSITEPGSPLGLIRIDAAVRTNVAIEPVAPVPVTTSPMAPQPVQFQVFTQPAQGFGVDLGVGFPQQVATPVTVLGGLDAGPVLQAEREVLKQLEGIPKRTSRFDVPGFTITTSQRNPTALFGSGVIDSIPEEAIVAMSKRRNADYPEISGRVSRLKDGRVGRFGWKGQTASLRDFTLTACAVEVGLNVPDHPQTGLPHDAEYAPTGLDLSLDECNSLINYLAKLPAPPKPEPAAEQHAKFLREAETMFERVGCAACHSPDVGDVKGIYSDLLLHDMGDDLGDTGSYGVFVPNSSPDDPPREDLAGADGQAPPKEPVGATRLEWRTPPLWGVRDSAPYMHDGRADTLEQAVALHGGEAKRSAQMYFALLPRERLQVLSLLRSFAAPVAN